MGNDGTTDLVVYTQHPVLPGGAFGPADIWYQPLVGGAPSGEPVQVTNDPPDDPTDDKLNDVSGDYIVYTAYDSTTADSGAIIVYQISTGNRHTLGTATTIQEPKIHGDRVVWREGTGSSISVMYYELGWIPIGNTPLLLAGPVPPTFEVQIGDRYAVWAELDGDYDISAYDFDALLSVQITDTPSNNERRPATSGAWIVWEQDFDSIEAIHMDTLERVSIDNGGGSFNPSVDGDLVAWETDVAGNWDIWVYRFSLAESYAVTTRPENQYLNDVFGNLVTYVDMSSGSEDVYVSTLEFIPEPTCPFNIDFDSTPEGDPVPAGTIVAEQWAAEGIHISCQNNNASHPDACTIFDSNNPTGGDTDLGTSNLNNLLIVAQDVEDLDGDGLVDDPDVEESGGQIRLTFDEPVLLHTVKVVDVDAGEEGSAVLAVTDAGGATIVVPIPVMDDNSVQDVLVGVPYTIELTVSFVGTGALADVFFCPMDYVSCDMDTDHDGICDNEDNCLSEVNPSQTNSDGDGLGNACDNCPYVSNPDQSDADGDGMGDACETDNDNDGLTDYEESIFGTNPLLWDTDGDGADDLNDAFPLDNTETQDSDAVEIRISQSSTVFFEFDPNDFPNTLLKWGARGVGVSGTRIVWVDTRDGFYDIYVYDQSTETETLIVTGDRSSVKYSPGICGERIVWVDERGGNPDIYMYDLSTNIETQLTADISEQRRPAILR